MKRSIGLIELRSIARGIETTDVMLKAADVELLRAHGHEVPAQRFGGKLLQAAVERAGDAAGRLSGARRRPAEQNLRHSGRQRSLWCRSAIECARAMW